MKRQNKSNYSSSIDVGEIMAVLLMLFISSIPFAGAIFGYDRGIEKGQSIILDMLKELGINSSLRDKIHYPNLYGSPSKEELCNAFCGKTDFPKEEDTEIGEN